MKLLHKSKIKQQQNYKGTPCPMIKDMVEYFIYDAISMVGSVGGTLGMCIGFSFTGMFTILINLIQNGINLIKAKLLQVV